MSKKYIFWDLETTGLNPAFDSIIQCAAVLTDEKFNVLDEFNIRGRMKEEYPVPSPSAMLVTEVPVEQLKNEKLSNFEMISEIQNKFLSWGEAVYLSYNGLKFDEIFLRQGLYQSALPPYLTNTNGNKRGDVMKLLHTAAAVAPNSFAKPINDETGKVTFRLELFAKANNITHTSAHDALSDCMATMEVCKLINERCHEVWESSLKTLSKQDVFEYINQDKVFCASRYFRGKEYTHALAYLTVNPTYNNQVYCFDLKYDPDLIFELDRSDLKKRFKGKDKCFHLVKANEQPILLDEKFLYGTEEFKDEDPEMIRDRMLKVRGNKSFIEKFGNLLIDMAEDKSLTSNQTERPFEEQIYDGFPDTKDNYLMSDFHAAEDENKYEISQKISDVRIKEFTKRVLYNTKPELLPKKVLERHQLNIAEKLLSTEKCAWKTIPDAMAELDDLRADEEKNNLELLEEIDIYLQELWDKFKDMKENT